MTARHATWIAACTLTAVLATSGPGFTSVQPLVSPATAGRRGGELVVPLRADPKTFNPVVALDTASREVIRRTIADLVHINRETQLTEPALAESWRVSPDGRKYTLALRRGVRFSDGEPFDADDVVFSFGAYLDEQVKSTNRDLLIIGGKPIVVRKIDSHTVEVELAEPYAAAERLFDSLAMLPRDRLERAYRDGKFAEMWNLGTAPADVAGLGPFRFAEVVPGQRIVLERNPYYWKVDRTGTQLPYLDRLVFVLVPNSDAQILRLEAGEADMVHRLTSVDYGVLARRQDTGRFRVVDLGPGTEHNFLFFNMNDLGTRSLAEVRRRQAWFRQPAFRQAVSLAIDRNAIVRLVYEGRGAALWGHVPPGNARWVNAAIPRPTRSIAKAKELLRGAGFRWDESGALLDGKGERVAFTIMTGGTGAERPRMATLIQADLKEIGVDVHVATLELRSMLDRVFTTYDYDACIMGLGGGDADPNGEMNVWMSSGPTHVWQLSAGSQADEWQREIDRLMRQQLTTLDYAARKKLYDRVQQIVADRLPVIPLASPHVLVGVKRGLGNFRPSVHDHYTLWNVEELFWQDGTSVARH